MFNISLLGLSPVTSSKFSSDFAKYLDDEFYFELFFAKKWKALGVRIWKGNVGSYTRKPRQVAPMLFAIPSNVLVGCSDKYLFQVGCQTRLFYV